MELELGKYRYFQGKSHPATKLLGVLIIACDINCHCMELELGKY